MGCPRIQRHPARAVSVFVAGSHLAARLCGERRIMGSSATAMEVPAARAEARLLVVEDEPTILELLSRSLRFVGFDVLTAASGQEALRAAAAARPDLILLDVMLPDGDGFHEAVPALAGRTRPVRAAGQGRADHSDHRPYLPPVHSRQAPHRPGDRTTPSAPRRMPESPRGWRPRPSRSVAAASLHSGHAL